jgi:hypothetical protein
MPPQTLLKRFCIGQAKSELREAIDIEQHLIDASRLVERPSATASHRTLPGGTTRLNGRRWFEKDERPSSFFLLDQASRSEDNYCFPN